MYGVNDGGFGIYVENFNTTDGFFYTLNGGAPSPTWVNSKVSPVLFTDKGAGQYYLQYTYHLQHFLAVLINRLHL